MAEKKYLNEAGLSRVAEYVNEKLKTVSAMPASPNENDIVLYVGSNTATYTQGNLYRFNGTDWVIADGTVTLSWSDYQALSPEAQTNGTTYFIYDAAGGDEKEVVNGYLNPEDGKFYKESTYETEISSTEEVLYIDLNTEKIYRYSSADQEYILLSGAGGGGDYTAGDGISISNTNEISAKIDNTSITTDSNDALKVADTYKTIFVGTQAQWDALSTADKVKYNEAHITDDVIGGEVASSVSDGDERPVSSDAVYDYVSPIKTVMPSGTSSSNKLVSQNTCFIGGTKYGSTYDCDTFGPGACLVNNQTLHTPYTQGLTSDDVFMVNTFVSDSYYKCQIAVGYGTARLYTRFRKDGGWSTWKSFIPAS